MKESDFKKHETQISHTVAHYLLVIHKLREIKGYARITDIAKEMALTKGSVSTGVNNLKKKGLICEEDDNKFLLLTEPGHSEVHRILSSRTLLFYFFRDILEIDEAQALRDSCLMEHLLSPQSREKFFSFMKSLTCQCEGEVSHKKKTYKMQLELCGYKNADEFINDISAQGPMIDD